MKATLYIPESGVFEEALYRDLPDQDAVICGRTAGYSLSDVEGYAIVTLSDGSMRRFGPEGEIL